MRHDTLVCIYIFIQLRKHYVRALGTNVIRKEDLKFQSFARQTKPKGPKRERSNNYIIWLSVYSETSCKSQVTVNLVKWRCVCGCAVPQLFPAHNWQREVVFDKEELKNNQCSPFLLLPSMSQMVSFDWNLDFTIIKCEACQRVYQQKPLSLYSWVLANCGVLVQWGVFVTWPRQWY